MKVTRRIDAEKPLNTSSPGTSLLLVQNTTDIPNSDADDAATRTMTVRGRYLPNGETSRNLPVEALVVVTMQRTAQNGTDVNERPACRATKRIITSTTFLLYSR